MNNDEKRKLYDALAAPFPEHSIQRTQGRLTGRGYDTTGIGYQHIVNRLNEVLGVGGFRPHRTITVREISRPNGRTAFEAVADVTLELGAWEGGQFVVFAEALADGGHVAASEADARKGAYTNAFKKCAAFFGVGRQAYEGTLDDDNVPDDPIESAQHHTTPPGYIRTPGPVVSPQQSGSRLTSKQLSAIWSLARKLGFEQAAFRAKAKTQFGGALEFLSREQASQVISSLSAQLNGNGSGDHKHDAHQPGSEG